jgi:hypothetical protein
MAALAILNPDFKRIARRRAAAHATGTQEVVTAEVQTPAHHEQEPARRESFVRGRRGGHSGGFAKNW